MMDFERSVVLLVQKQFPSAAFEVTTLLAGCEDFVSQVARSLEYMVVKVGGVSGEIGSTPFPSFCNCGPGAAENQPPVRSTSFPFTPMFLSFVS
ncbi:hypothetical protein T05_13864 [Trichinella murrelli]|uniref:Uncharacterized protein n=1 Tax=Trichinella murrelli TaxID=144512 RepID=A0A0V0TYY7_9BILA|nr:hypothetical protein T05_13864 [Trichinella murrelli]